MEVFRWPLRLHTEVILISLLTSCGYVDAVSQQVLAKTLYDHLMTDYDTSLIPLCNSTTTVTLNMDIALRQIMDLNEREQVLTTNLWMRLRWNDCRLTWDPASYNNLTSLMVTYDDVWLPDISLYDSASDDDMLPGLKENRAYISSSGSVTYNFPTVAKSICRVNVRYFPFDTQECPLQFGSWSHHGNELDIVKRNEKGKLFTGDISNYVENAEWTVDEFAIERHVLYYNCCPEPYPDVTFYVIMKRRPTFYILTMIFPCILTAVISALGFVLPVESGEKVSLQVTVLLSLAVFLLLVSESLPPSSDNFPVIGIYFATSMAFVSASLAQTVIVLNVYYRGTNGRTVPRWARLIFFHYIGKVLGVRTKDPDAVHPIEKMPRDQSFLESMSEHNDKEEFIPTDNVSKVTNEHHKAKSPCLRKPPNNFVSKDATGRIKEQIDNRKAVAEEFSDKPDAESINTEWRDLANVLDRVFLISYVLVSFVSFLAFIIQCV
ncbi:neuronal acetylcholine receptor subunit alpha-9-like [Mercenaria mercenaria]|uniref:neuronal acetylcholine receptor subunit alpha-9-like n=1 Tax=Mercenaria mercenaria TaxID=6596 RepID=UPI00234FA44F|nr:neuronal acetylcholine receptor subunit alpha-9-like [Mercenaria mercenaria]